MTLPAGSTALVAVTPKRQSSQGAQFDNVLWKTDVTGAAKAKTMLTATFLNSGSAIAPSSLDFGRVAIHLDSPDAQEVTIQNCDVVALELDPPQISAPFSIDSNNFPTMLQPGETAKFSVGFHPTKAGEFDKTLIITSAQLVGAPLMVALTGTGSAGGTGGDGGSEGGGADQTSFYACNGCASNDPSGALLLGLASVFVVYRRRHGRSH
jgi:hypothetical protein